MSTSKNKKTARLSCTLAACVAASLLCFCIPDFLYAQNRVHTVYYEDTDHELHVYRIYGETPGKTLLLIGGIQGDEPGGFLSADLYADLSLAKGNLIVVPRANFRSIVLQRRKINEDMNRKFAGETNSNYETKIVATLKQLIRESDCLLNLHDGSGFFSENWENQGRNPFRYGQSIIADCDTHVNSQTGEKIELGAMARSVSEQINRQIKNPAHHFHFNNHRSAERTTSHKEQRKSATYYALYSCGIPAFGIETSKSLPLGTKVRHHNLAINAFMERLGITPETPGLNLAAPELRYLVISVNGALPVAVTNGQTLKISPGDWITISHIETNYERGLSADILGYGSMNDLRKKIKINEDTRIIIRKDYYPCGSISVETEKEGPGGRSTAAAIPVRATDPDRLWFEIKINGELRIVPRAERIEVIRGDTLEIVEVLSNRSASKDMKVNFKGYVGDPRNNTGEDRGYVIRTEKDLWKRYSLAKDGKTYQVIVTHEDRVLGKLYFDLVDPVLKYVILQASGKQPLSIFSGSTVFVDPDENLTLVDVATNIPKNNGIGVFLIDRENAKEQIELKRPFMPQRSHEYQNRNLLRPCRIDIERNSLLIGSIYVTSNEGNPPIKPK
jgi:Carboxypeptidase controlling helical cell shape catalytic